MLVHAKSKFCKHWYEKHDWKPAPDYDDDWGGVTETVQCVKCGLIRQTCHPPLYKRYYLRDV